MSQHSHTSSVLDAVWQIGSFKTEKCAFIPDPSKLGQTLIFQPFKVRQKNNQRTLKTAMSFQAYRVVLPGRLREIVLDPDYEAFRRAAVQEITPTIDRLLTRLNAVVVAPVELFYVTRQLGTMA
jgi:hypothetical protein